MKRIKFGYFIFGILAYAGFLLWLAPAQIVYSMYNQYLPNNNRPIFFGLDGPWHSANATHAEFKELTVNSPQWRLIPFEIIKGHFAIDCRFRLDNDQITIRFIASPNHYGLSNIQGQFKAEILEQILPSDYALPLAGRILLDLERLEVSNEKIVAATGTISWHEAGTILAPIVSLGDLQLKMTTSDHTVTATLTDQGGPLAAQGKLLLFANNSYKLNATLGVRDHSQTALKDFLYILGQPDNSGSVSMALKGALELPSW